MIENCQSKICRTLTPGSQAGTRHERFHQRLCYLTPPPPPSWGAELAPLAAAHPTSRQTLLFTPKPFSGVDILRPLIVMRNPPQGHVPPRWTYLAGHLRRRVVATDMAGTRFSH